MNTSERAAAYGARETNGLADKGERDAMLRAQGGPIVAWNSPELARVTRLRLLSDPGYPEWDVSYCVGEMKDGTPCRVDVPFRSLPRRGMVRAIIDHAKRDGVYAKRLGILDNISTLV